MGRVQIIPKEQAFILEKIAQEPRIYKEFYFTGGTALNTVYLKHRESVDLDLFSSKKFDNQALREVIKKIAKENSLKIQEQFTDPVYMYFLVFPNGKKIKVDFSYYPYRRFSNPTFYLQNIETDGLFDIAINKLLTVIQRHQVKDYVDLFYLMPEFGFWDLKEGVEKKFGIKIDLFLIASDFLAVEDFTFLPKMVKPLTLDDLKTFFREQAKKLARTVVE